MYDLTSLYGQSQSNPALTGAAAVVVIFQLLHEFATFVLCVQIAFSVLS